MHRKSKEFWHIYNSILIFQYKTKSVILIFFETVILNIWHIETGKFYLIIFLICTFSCDDMRERERERERERAHIDLNERGHGKDDKEGNSNRW